MHMSHRYESFKKCYEIEIHRSYFFNFCVGGQVHFWNFGLSRFKIKFPIELYASYAYLNSRICNIADVLKIERMQ